MSVALRNFLISLVLLPLFALGCSSLIGAGGGSSEDPFSEDPFNDAPVGAVEVPSVATVAPPPTLYHYYIDPTAPVGGDGTIENPYQDLSFLGSDVGGRQLQSDSAYYFKSGTEIHLSTGDHLAMRTSASETLKNIVIAAYGEGEKPILVSDSTQGDGVINVGNPDGDYENLFIDGLEIYSTTGTPSAMVAVQTTYGLGTNLVIQNCKLKGSYNVIRHMGSGASPDSGLRILQNELYGSMDDGILTGFVNDVEVAGNYIYAVNQKWFEFLEEHPDGVYCPENGETYLYCPGDRNKDIVEVCRHHFDSADDCGGDAVQLIDGDNLWIHKNEINRTDTGNKFGIIVSNVAAEKAIGCVIEHNTIKGPLTGTAVYIAGRADADIRFNKILAPHSHAIIAQHTDEVNIVGNVMSGSSGGGVSLGLAAEGVQTRRTVFNNVFHDIHGCMLAPVGEPTEVRNNIFSNEPGDPVVWGAEWVTGSHNLFLTDENTFGTDNVIGDPLFVNPDEFNFRLQAESPAIDAGTMIGLDGSPVDMDGAPIAQGSAPDVGAYEQL